MGIATRGAMGALLLLLSADALADGPESAASRIRGHVEYLADDLLEGRGPGTPRVRRGCPLRGDPVSRHRAGAGRRWRLVPTRALGRAGAQLRGAGHCPCQHGGRCRCRCQPICGRRHVGRGFATLARRGRIHRLWAGRGGLCRHRRPRQGGGPLRPPAGRGGCGGRLPRCRRPAHATRASAWRSGDRLAARPRRAQARRYRGPSHCFQGAILQLDGLRKVSRSVTSRCAFRRCCGRKPRRGCSRGH